MAPKKANEEEAAVAAAAAKEKVRASASQPIPVIYPSGPVSQNSLFGTSIGLDGNPIFQFQGEVHLFSDPTLPARTELIQRGGDLTLRSFISSGVFDDVNRIVYWKPAFLFGDEAPDTRKELIAEENRWFYAVGESIYYIPTIRRHYPLSYFKCTTKERKMEWNLTYGSASVLPGWFYFRSVGVRGPPAFSRGLLPSTRKREIPAGEIPSIAPLFIHSFVKAGGNYPAADF